MKESDIVLEICRWLVSGSRSFKVDLRRVDLMRVMAVASKHRVLPIVADFLLNSEAQEFLKSVKLDEIAYNSLNMSRLSHRSNKSEALELSNLFKKSDVSHLLRKGFVYAEKYYAKPHLRCYNDIDIYVSEVDIADVMHLLRERGYESGYYSRRINSIVPMNRQKIIAYMMYPTHCPPMSRLTNDSFITAYKVDIATRMSWPNSKFNPISEEILKYSLINTYYTENGSIGSNAFNFIDCALHMYRETMFKDALKMKSSERYNLRQFVDLALIYKSFSTDDRKYIQTLINQQIAYVLKWASDQTDKILGTSICPAIFDENLKPGLSLSECYDKDLEYDDHEFVHSNILKYYSTVFI